MKRLIAITDLTRMQENRVCIAGYDKHLECVRLTLPPPGILESSLYAKGKPIIYPFAVVELELVKAHSKPPHTEDYRYDPGTVRFMRPVRPHKRQSFLDATLSESVAALFEQPIQKGTGCYVMRGQGSRSLGTIRPQKIIETVYYPIGNGGWWYRLELADGEGETYRVGITDLTWRYYLDHQRRTGRTPKEIVTRMTRLLNDRDVYLRLGLARRWEKYPDRCYLQITGVHTIPDYLRGRTFADFTPAA